MVMGLIIEIVAEEENIAGASRRFGIQDEGQGDRPPSGTALPRTAAAFWGDIKLLNHPCITLTVLHFVATWGGKSGAAQGSSRWVGRAWPPRQAGAQQLRASLLQQSAVVPVPQRLIGIAATRLRKGQTALLVVGVFKV